MDTQQFVHSPTVGHLDCLQFGTSMNRAAINICFEICM